MHPGRCARLVPVEQADPTPDPRVSAVLPVAFVPGVMPDRWAARWRERSHPVPLELVPITVAEQLEVLDSGAAEMCFLRLPVTRDDLHLVRLYAEEVCVVAAAEHPIAVFSELALADLAGEPLFVAPDSVSAPTTNLSPVDVPDLTTAQAVETVAAGTGVVLLPRSVARLHHRKDVVARRVHDIAPAPVALAWLRTPAADGREAVRQDFVGVVRGRTARSTRDTAPTRTPRQQRSGETKSGPSAHSRRTQRPRRRRR